MKVKYERQMLPNRQSIDLVGLFDGGTVEEVVDLLREFSAKAKDPEAAFELDYRARIEDRNALVLVGKDFPETDEQMAQRIAYEEERFRRYEAEYGPRREKREAQERKKLAELMAKYPDMLPQPFNPYQHPDKDFGL